MTADRSSSGAPPVAEMDLLRLSPFLADLVGDGSWRQTENDLAPAVDPAESNFGAPPIQAFRRDFRQTLDDPEAALLALRRLRVRGLLAIGRADLNGLVKPHQVRAHLRGLSEALVQGAWQLAEHSLREKYVHPLIYERRNINPPLVICSLSRLGAGEPWYTTGPSPIFVHSRAAEFAPALTGKDFDTARRSDKKWLPAREYFHRLARRTMSYLSAPSAAGKGFGHMAEDLAPDHPPLPGALVILFGAFDEHFLNQRPIRERLALLRLRVLVGQDKLGRAVEKAARVALARTARETGRRLKSGINAFYRERAAAENLPMTRGGLLDIERGVRALQFKLAADDPETFTPSPLKALDRLAAAGIITGDQRLTLHRAYSWQWFVANRISLLGVKSDLTGDGLRSKRLDEQIRRPGAAARTLKEMKAAKSALSQAARGGA